MYEAFQTCESTKETKKRLEQKTDKELINFLIDVDNSIKCGFTYDIYYQEYSVGTDILRKRGYRFYTTEELKKLKGDE